MTNGTRNFTYDGKMNYERAKKELELSDSFTDNELKKAYHKLSYKYHPDLNGITDEEKYSFSEHMKAINDAYKYLKNQTIEKYKEEKFEQFVHSIHCQSLKETIKIKYLGSKVASLIIDLSTSFSIVKSKEEVDTLINKAYKDFDDILVSFVDEFCEKNGITKQDLNICFNLTLELKNRDPKQLCFKLDDALKKIKEIKIEQIIQGYIGYAGYADIKDKIDILKNQAINSKDKINEILKKLKCSIDKTFENYFNNIKLKDELSKTYKSVNGEEVLGSSILSDLSNIYISKSAFINGRSFFVQKGSKINGKIYRVNGSDVSLQGVFIYKDYISLADAFVNFKEEDKITFHRFLEHGPIYVIYSFGDRYICFEEDSNGEIRVKIYRSDELSLEDRKNEFIKDLYKIQYEKYTKNKIKSISEILNKTIDEYEFENKSMGKRKILRR